MIDFVGDLSKADAEVLADFATMSKDILEFGCGGSTQILAHFTEGKVISLDTERVWMEKTAAHLARLKIEPGKCYILPYEGWIEKPDGMYDLVFNDGADSLRRYFGLAVWKHIKPGGWLLLHDQRRRPDWDTTAHIISEYWQEIGNVYYNYEDSNITCIQKRIKPAIYENWQETENVDMAKW